MQRSCPAGLVASRLVKLELEDARQEVPRVWHVGQDVVLRARIKLRLGPLDRWNDALELPAQVDALIQSATARIGRIDVLVNNAGLGGQTPVADMTDEEWDRVLNVTLTSVFRATRAALRYFRDAQHGGIIVNNASVLGWRAQHSQSHYAAAKAGVMALTRCSAIEAAEYGVRINAVSPSIARHKFLEKTSSADLLDRLSADETFGRAAEPWEVAATIAFLASDCSSYLTGEVISVSRQHP